MDFLKLFKKPKNKSDVQILIVDDEEGFLDSMALWFKTQGYIVGTAPGGCKALEFLKQNSPDIIFLDIFMPDMDGFETLKAIRKQKTKIPVIMLTAFDLQESHAQAVAAGANAIFEKTDGFYKAEHMINSFVRIVSKKQE